MADGAITMEFTADEARAIKAMMALEAKEHALLNAAKKINDEGERGERVTRRHAAAQEAHAGAIETTVMGYLKGVGAAVSFGAAVAEVASSVARVAAQRNAFQETMTPLLGMGDNIDNIKEVSAEVLTFSVAMGMGLAEVVKFETAAARLSDEIRGPMIDAADDLAGVYGGEVAPALAVMTKAYKAYGDTVADIEPIQSRLALLHEKTGMEFEAMAASMPQLMVTAKQLGISLDEVTGAIITQVGAGLTEDKAIQGLAKTFLKMEEAGKQGVTLTGSLADKIDQLAAADPEILKEIFGEKAVVGARALADNSTKLRENIEAVKDVKINLVDEKKLKRLEDASYRIAENTKSAKAAQEAVSLGEGAGTAEQRANERWELTKAGAGGMLPPWARGGKLQSLLATSSAVASWGGDLAYRNGLIGVEPNASFAEQAGAEGVYNAKYAAAKKLGSPAAAAEAEAYAAEHKVGKYTPGFQEAVKGVKPNDLWGSWVQQEGQEPQPAYSAPLPETILRSARGSALSREEENAEFMGRGPSIAEGSTFTGDGEREERLASALDRNTAATEANSRSAGQGGGGGGPVGRGSVTSGGVTTAWQPRPRNEGL